jgi:predicted deacylase
MDDDFKISGIRVKPGETREIYLKVSESFLATSIQIPVTVIRGRRPGPKAFVTAAVHGDEINGTDIVRRLIFDMDHEHFAGTLIAIPVVNIPGFHSQSRYLPYHRDLNRFFPGKKDGNNAERIAWRVFQEVVLKCDFGIDLHTASMGRKNLPQIRGDMSNSRVRDLARAFGASVVVDQQGLKGSLRKEATTAGVPTILFEAGESGRFSTSVSLAGLHGVLRVLQEMDMWDGSSASGGKTSTLRKPPFQVIVKDSDWIRAEKGGILDLGLRPGDLVYKGDPIASILNPFGKTVTEMTSPVTGIVIGITTAPLSIPGTGIVHIARLKKTLARVERSLNKMKKMKKTKKSKKQKQKQKRISS